MTFEDAPTYEEKAALAPVTVRRVTTTGKAMYFAGGAENASRIIDWVLLNNGTATWMEERPEEIVSDPEGFAHHLPHVPERISLRDSRGKITRVHPGDWVVQNAFGFTVEAGEHFPTHFHHV